MRLFRRSDSQRVKPTFQVVVHGKRDRFGRHNLGLRSPVLIAAFEGWNDAAEAASNASRYLEKALTALPFGEIDGEEFYDFTNVRPESVQDENGTRRIIWPSTSLFVASSPEFAHDIVILRAAEPQLRWRTYCDVLIDCMARFGIERVITLGAYLSEVTHRRPVAVNISTGGRRETASSDPAATPYEGPTGIIGALSQALTAAGIANSSVWASVPCYSLPTSQKAALALVETTATLLGRSVDTTDLEAEALEYEARMNDLVEDDENIAAYVARIEEMEDAADEEISTDGLTEEIERYLRGRSS